MARGEDFCCSSPVKGRVGEGRRERWSWVGKGDELLVRGGEEQKVLPTLDLL